MTQDALRALEVTAGHSRRDVLAGASLTVPRASITALLGRNGAGKTTFLDVALGLLPRQGGELAVQGIDPARDGDGVRRCVAAVSSDEPMDEGERVRELIRLHASLRRGFRQDLADRLFARFAVDGARRVRELSRGQRQKVAILIALASGVDFLILDEPFDGLDIGVRDEITGALVEHVDETGAAVLVASHDIGEIERLADRVAILNGGRIVAEGPVDRVCGRVRRWSAVATESFDPTALPSGFSVEVRAKRVLVTFVGEGAPDFDAVAARGLGAVESLPETGLRDAFLTLTQPTGAPTIEEVHRW